MRMTLNQTGGIALILGAILFALYSSLFFVLLPIGSGNFDLAAAVMDPDWLRLTITAFLGILLMLYGFYAVYARLQNSSGGLGATGFLLIELAYLLQACKVTWEIFLYPVIAANPGSAFLLRDGVLKHAPAVMLFRSASSLIIFAGILLFCAALYRSRQFPKIAPVLVFAGALLYAVGPFISIFVGVPGIFLFAIGCSLLGLHLLRNSRA